MTTSPSKIPAIKILASQIALTVVALSERENINLRVTISTAERVLSVGTENAYVEASRPSRSQYMLFTTVARIACAMKD